MDYNKQHPLSQITGSSSLSMLEMLIPYVDYPFKLPLALFIKFHEIRLIINTLQNADMIEQFSLHNTNNSPADMLASFTGISPDMLQMLMGMAENGFPGMNPEFSPETQNPFPSFGMGGFPPPDSASFDDRMNQLFSEYDNQIERRI